MDEATELSSNFFVVGLGASAGGLRSLEEFFENMPTDSGAAFVVVQHLSPDYRSMMPELLERRTAMVIYLAEDAMRLAPNSIYLIPPGNNLVVQNRTLYLLERPQRREHRPNFPIDIFFEALAGDCLTHCIGVVLSGSGSDGSRGLTAIREQGGITMVQDPETAEFDGMPQTALLTGVVDRVSGPRTLARSIYHLLQLSSKMSPQQALTMGSQLKAEVATESLQQVARILATGNHVDFTHYRPSTLSRRIRRRCLVKEFSDLEDYIQYLEQSTEEQNILRNEFLINVTHFFRNQDAWAYLEAKVIPQIFQQSKSGESLRFWVTACATGEEAYSLAILLDEARRRLNQSVQLKIFATDIDEVALEKASQGVYPKTISKDISPERLQQYFTSTETGYEVSHTLREMLIYSKHNLIQDAGFSQIHLVSCRNFLIYLQPSLQQKVLTMLHFSLVTSGVLFLGESETPGELEPEFISLNRKWKLYEKRRDVQLSRAVTRRKPLRSRLYPQIPSSTKSQVDRVSPLMDTAIKQILEHHQITCYLVDPDYTLRYVVADPLKLLKIPTGKLTHNLIEMVPEPLQIPLTTALRRAAQAHRTVQFKDIALLWEEQERTLAVRVTHHNQETLDKLLIVELQVETSAYNSEVASLSQADNGGVELVRELEKELYLTRQDLQTTIEELETTNEEQQSSNEELIASNEELQSSNEELQSVNEELHTLNAEYQSKNHQLSELNTDLDNLLQNTQVGVIFLDADLKIRRFTEAAKSVINLLDSDIGRSVRDLSWKIDCPDLIDLIHQVSHERESMEREVRHRETGQYLLASIHPYRLENRIGDGTVLTFVGIDRLKQAEVEVQASEERYALVLQGVGAGIWDWNVQANSAYISTRYKQVLGYEDDEIATEISFDEFATMLHPEDRDRLLEALTNHFQRRVPYDVEYRIRKKSGDYCWIHSTGQATWDDAGNPLRMAGSIIDISDRKAAEADLAQAKEQLEKRVIERTAQLTNSSQAQQRIYQIGLQSYDSLEACLDTYLKAGCDIFDLEHGIVAQVVGRTYTIRSIQSQGTDLTAGAELDYADTYCVPVIEQQQTICYRQVGLLPEESRPGSYEQLGLETYIATPILVRDQLYGTINFSSSTPRSVDFEPYYQELIRLMALGIGREIEAWQAQAQLQESNTRYELVFQGAGTGIVDWDIPADRAILSNRFKAIFGFEPHEECFPTFETFLQAVHPDDREGLQQAVTAHFEQCVPYLEEYRVLNKQGEYFWVQATGEAVLDEQGSPLRMVVGVVDISARKTAEASLKASEERYHLVVQGVGAGIWDWDILTDTNYMSPKFKQILGYEENEIDDSLEEWELRVHPDDLERVWELHNNHLQHRVPYEAEYRMRTKAGDYLWILDTAQAVWDDAGNPIRMVGSIVDISARKAAEAALEVNK